jgi:UDP-2,3-diacylglucosamine pyrophosphatase LpxH
MLELSSDTLVVFVSDSHIGGDRGCDGFESPGELEALFVELAGREGPVELILAGDFFDFLQIGEVADGENRASLTMERPEYRDLFAALKRFREAADKRVIYLPGNHDAESFWNKEIQKTLRERGLVDEFAYYYLASVETGGVRRIVHDPLDTPLGHHVVMDGTRRIAPYGEVAPGLDLSEIKMVYPLVAIPAWIASRYFYNLAGRIVSYLLVPLLVAYALYKVVAYAVSRATDGKASLLFGSYRELPQVHQVLLDTVLFLILIVGIFGVFFLVVRHAVHKTLKAVSPGGSPHYSPAEASQRRIRAVLAGEARPPMDPSFDPTTADVFVSGHTHLPSLAETERPDGSKAVLVNSGCFLRQLQPIAPRLKGPPIFVSRFVLTHVRVFAREGQLRVELWEQPKPAGQTLTRIERLASMGRRPPQPSAGAKPRLVASAEL